MNQAQDSRGNRNTIEPYYRNNVFERDPAYYNQIPQAQRRSKSLRNTQRNSNQRNVSPNRQPKLTQVQSEYRNTYQLNQNQYNSVISKQTNLQNSQAIQTNISLKKQLQQLMAGNNQFGTSPNVVKLQHYNFNQNDIAKLKEQQAEIRRLESIIQNNKDKIISFKKAGEQLSIRMNNIQSIDKEIYKTLQGSVNRDRELLQRASSGLARGQRREDIAKILHQIIA